MTDLERGGWAIGGGYTFPANMSRAAQLDYLTEGAAVIESNLRAGLTAESMGTVEDALPHVRSIFDGTASVPLLIESVTQLLESAHVLLQFCEKHARELDRIKGGKRFRAQVAHNNVGLAVFTLVAYRQCAERLRTQC